MDFGGASAAKAWAGRALLLQNRSSKVQNNAETIRRKVDESGPWTHIIDVAANRKIWSSIATITIFEPNYVAAIGLSRFLAVNPAVGMTLRAESGAQCTPSL